MKRYFFLDDLWLNSFKLNLLTDASGAHGFGAKFGSHWCYGKRPANWENQNTAILEFYHIVPLGRSHEQSVHIVFY